MSGMKNVVQNDFRTPKKSSGWGMGGCQMAHYKWQAILLIDFYKCLLLIHRDFK